MLNLIQGYWVSRAVYIVAKLGIPDLLNDGSKTSEELAEATGTHAPLLYCLLRELASSGAFDEDEHGRLSLTRVGATLRTEVPGSLRFFAMEELEGNHYVVWKEVLESIHTGAMIQPGQQRDGDNEKGDRIHRHPGDENDDPLAIMW
jgi:hypothetical protein